MGNTCSACKGDQDKKDELVISLMPQKQLKEQIYLEDKELDVQEDPENPEVDDKSAVRLYLSNLYQRVSGSDCAA